MRRALIVGIDDYPGCPLQGCVNDAQRMKDVLSRNYDGSVNFECQVITCPPDTVSRSLLRRTVAAEWAVVRDQAKMPSDGGRRRNPIRKVGVPAFQIPVLETGTSMPLHPVPAVARS